MKTMYHWTYVSSLEQILREGLVPSRPQMYDNQEGVYLWDDTEEGMRRASHHASRIMAGYNVCLIVNVDGLNIVPDEADSYDGGSWICTDQISPDRIAVDMESCEFEDYATEVAAIINSTR